MSKNFSYEFPSENHAYAFSNQIYIYYHYLTTGKCVLVQSRIVENNNPVPLTQEDFRLLLNLANKISKTAES